MTDQEGVLCRFSANWADALDGALHSIGGRVLRRPDAVALDVGRPAGLQNSVVPLEPLHGATMHMLMSTLNSFFELETAKRAGTV